MQKSRCSRATAESQSIRRTGRIGQKIIRGAGIADANQVGPIGRGGRRAVFRNADSLTPFGRQIIFHDDPLGRIKGAVVEQDLG